MSGFIIENPSELEIATRNIASNLYLKIFQTVTQFDDPIGYAEKHGIGLPTPQLIDGLSTTLLQEEFNTLVITEGYAFIVIPNESDYIQVISFDEYLSYAHKRVISDGVERAIDKGVWETLFCQEAPKYVVAMASSRITSSEFIDIRAHVAEGIIRVHLHQLGQKDTPLTYAPLAKAATTGRYLTLNEKTTVNIVANSKNPHMFFRQKNGVYQTAFRVGDEKSEQSETSEKT